MKVRVAAAQFRQLKAGQVEYQRCMRKASMAEKTAIDEILHMMVLEEKTTNPKAETDEAPPLPILKQPRSPITKKNPSSGSKESPGTQMFGFDTTSFFKAFEDDPKESPKKKVDAVVNEKALVLYEPPQESPRPVMKRGLARSNLSIEDSTEHSRPTLRRQLARSSFDLDSKELETLALALEEKVQPNKSANPQHKKSSMKKPAAKTAMKGKAKPKAKAQAEDPPQSPAPKKKVKKSSFRRRKKDSAYHSAKLQAKKEGCSPNTQVRKAAEASRQIAHQIDLGLLKEDEDE